MENKKQQINNLLYEAHRLMMELLEEERKLDYLKLATKIREVNQKLNTVK